MKKWIYLAAALTLITLGGCGGSGGGAALPANNWDLMAWDQGQWQ